jgi:uncharacterized membrane protein
VGIDDAALRYNQRGRPGTFAIVASVLLLILQAGLVWVAMMLALAFGMSTDSCAYQRCGSETWVGLAMLVTLPGGVAVFVACVVTVVKFLAKRRRAAWVPALGCLVQVLLMLAGWVMARQAGPII